MRQLFAALLILCPLQALAEDNAACAEVWEDIVVFAGPLGEEIAAASVESGADDWCAVSATLDIDQIEATFRVDQLAQAPQGARSIEVTLQDVYARVGVFDVTAALSYQTDSGALRLHQLTARAGDGRGLRASANLMLDEPEGRVDLQAVLPELRTQDLSVAIFVTPGLLQEAGVDLADLTRVAINEALSEVSEQQVSRRARSEFLRFVGAVPNARGTLDVTLDMPGGKSVMQIAGAFAALGTDAELADVLAAALADATLDLAWKPGRM